MMQPEGRSQQGKLEMQKDTCPGDRPARQSSAIGFIDAAGTDPSTDAVPSLLMRRALKKDDRRAAPMVGDS